jgi:protoporphyrinogen/coproporphyrinogen III oxidase
MLNYFAQSSTNLTWQISKLGLASKIRWIHKDDPALRTRYIYLGSDGLYKLPSSLLEVVRESMQLRWTRMDRMLWYIILRFFTRYKKPDGVEDESLATFVGRILGLVAVNDFLSAVMHGVWAGNVEELSVRAVMRGQPQLWDRYKRGDLSIWRLLSETGPGPNQPEPYKAHFYLDSNMKLMSHDDFKNSGAFYLSDGLQQVVGSLELSLKMMNNVVIKKGASVIDLQRAENGQIKVCTSEPYPSHTIDIPHRSYSQAIPVMACRNLLLRH